MDGAVPAVMSKEWNGDDPMSHYRIGVLIVIMFFSCGFPDTYQGEVVGDEITGLEIYLPQRRLTVGDTVEARVLWIYSTGEKLFAVESEVNWRVEGEAIAVEGRGIVSACAPGEGILIATLGNYSATEVVIVVKPVDYSQLLLCEVFYDDIGSDDAEFIEIYNGSDEECDLSGVMLVDGNEKSTPFIFPEKSTISVQSRAIIAKSSDSFLNRFGVPPDYAGFSFSLNNTGETVFLKVNEMIIDAVYIEGGSSGFPADLTWGSDTLPVASEGNAVHRIAGDTDTFADWMSGEPSPGQ
jgi:hypothetical protein